MSLINEMLHDLDSTRSKQDKTAATDPLLSESGLLDTGSTNTWIPGLVAFVVVASLLLLQQLNKDDATGKDIGEKLDAKLAVVEPVSSEESLKKSALSKPEKTLLAPNYYPKLINSMASEQGTDEEHLTETPIIDRQESYKDEVAAREKKISELLAAASKAFALDRLLSPAEDNACDRYREILLLEPNHPQAINGLESAANRYINLALDYAAQGNTLRAKVLLRRAEAVMPESTVVRNNIEQARERLLAIKKQDDVRLQPLQAEGSPVSAQLEDEGAAQQEKDSVKVAAPSNQNFVRSSSNEWRDLNTARKAKRLISKGRIDDAVVALKLFLDGAPESLHSLDLLLHTLIERGDIAEAQRYLLAAKHLGSSDIIEYNAHILVATDSVSEAIELLETQLPSASEDYSYQVLLAGLYHRDGNYTSSVAAYSRLLREHDKKSEYWLGLAVSLDSLNRDDEALQAFISAKDATQNKQVQRYIAARIQALTNKISANSKLQPQVSKAPS